MPWLNIQVLTNPAKWSEDGDVLKVKPHHQQTACRSCPINLCKREVLQKYLHNKLYDTIAYVGMYVTEAKKIDK